MVAIGTPKVSQTQTRCCDAEHSENIADLGQFLAIGGILNWGREDVK